MLLFVAFLLILSVLFGVGVALNVLKFSVISVIVLAALVMYGIYLESCGTKSNADKKRGNRRIAIFISGVGAFLVCLTSGVAIMESLFLGGLIATISWLLLAPSKQKESKHKTKLQPKTATNNPIKKLFITREEVPDDNKK